MSFRKNRTACSKLMDILLCYSELGFINREITCSIGLNQMVADENEMAPTIVLFPAKQCKWRCSIELNGGT
jgi:hypothetical protein